VRPAANKARVHHQARCRRAVFLHNSASVPASGLVPPYACRDRIRQHTGLVIRHPDARRAIARYRLTPSKHDASEYAAGPDRPAPFRTSHLLETQEHCAIRFRESGTPALGSQKDLRKSSYMLVERAVRGRERELACLCIGLLLCEKRTSGTLRLLTFVRYTPGSSLTDRADRQTFVVPVLRVVCYGSPNILPVSKGPAQKKSRSHTRPTARQRGFRETSCMLWYGTLVCRQHAG
jgi:hypothetical protein